MLVFEQMFVTWNKKVGTEVSLSFYHVVKWLNLSQE